MNRSHAAISLFIVFCVVMQAWAYFLPRERHIYPFVDYPMYRKAYGEPVEASVSRMYAELADGSRVEVTPRSMGLNFFAWKDLHVRRILAEPTDNPRWKDLVEEHRLEALNRVLRSVESQEDQHVVALHFETTIHRLVDGRFVEIPEQQTVPIPPEVGDERDGGE